MEAAMVVELQVGTMVAGMRAREVAMVMEAMAVEATEVE